MLTQDRERRAEELNLSPSSGWADFSREAAKQRRQEARRAFWSRLRQALSFSW